jgi:hypothetical protein
MGRGTKGEGQEVQQKNQQATAAQLMRSAIGNHP